MNKIDGIYFLKNLNFPSIELLCLGELENNPNMLEHGISVRLSSKSASDRVDVYLKSIHNIRDLEQIKKFILENRDYYDIIIHKTVKPELIGTVSKYNNGVTDIIAIEIYNNFDDRSHGIISYSANVEMIDNMVISINNEDFISKNLFVKVMYYLRKIDLDEYTFEFVVEDGKLLFTDFYSNSLMSKKFVINRF